MRDLGNPLGNPLGLARAPHGGARISTGIGQVVRSPLSPGPSWIPMEGQIIYGNDLLRDAIGGNTISETLGRTPSISGTGGNAYSMACAFTANGSHLAVSAMYGTYLAIYRRDGETFIRLPNPTLPPGTSYGCSFSPDGLILVVLSSPTPMVYRREGDTFTPLSISGFPAGGLGVSFSPDGSILAIAHTGGIYMCRREGEIFTALPSPVGLPSGVCRDCKFSSDGKFFIVAGDSAPRVTMYSVEGEVFTKLPNPETTPTAGASAVALSPDGSYVAVGVNTAAPNNMVIYRRNGSTLTKLPALSGQVTPNSVSFTPDGNHLVCAHSGSPFITVYRRTGDTFANLPNPKSLPSSNGRGCSLTSDGGYIAISSDDAPHLKVYGAGGLFLPTLPDYYMRIKND